MVIFPWKNINLTFFSHSLHTSEKRGLCLTKCSSETLQNLPYFRNTKIHIVFFRFSFCATLFFPLMNALVQGKAKALIKEKIKWHKMNNQKNYTQFFLFQKYVQILKRYAGTFHQA